ncbi:MAG TPA: hypothetical protein HA343_01240 [Methanomassiliicoccales archaeon]|nr:hypothetical protein [Methanomassiliicoccales archaeon]
MARKRRIEASPPVDEPQEEDEVIDVRSDRDIAIEGTWKEWFQIVFMKYCYAVGILFLACIVPLEALRQLGGDLGLGVAFVSVLLIIPLGIFGYLKLWGDGGIWGREASEDS